jgi:hypothetical protein
VALGGYLGNYVLGFQTLFDVEGTAALINAAFATNAAIATDRDYAGTTYYLTYAQRALGYQDLEAWTSLPTGAIYRHPRTGVLTAVVFNPAATAQPVTFYLRGAVLGTADVPARSTLSVPVGSLRPQLLVAPNWMELAPTNFTLLIDGLPGSQAVLDRSRNLKTWTHLATVPLTTNGLATQAISTAPLTVPGFIRASGQ